MLNFREFDCSQPFLLPSDPQEWVPGLVNYFTARGSPIGGYESDTIEALINELEGTIDPEERDRIAGEAFTYLYEQYADIPLAAVHAEMTVDPAVVADWTFPGVTTNSLSHWHLIQKAD